MKVEMFESFINLNLNFRRKWIYRRIRGLPVLWLFWFRQPRLRHDWNCIVAIQFRSYIKRNNGFRNQRLNRYDRCLSNTVIFNSLLKQSTRYSIFPNTNSYQNLAFLRDNFFGFSRILSDKDVLFFSNSSLLRFSMCFRMEKRNRSIRSSKNSGFFVDWTITRKDWTPRGRDTPLKTM